MYNDALANGPITARAPLAPSRSFRVPEKGLCPLVHLPGADVDEMECACRGPGAPRERQPRSGEETSLGEGVGRGRREPAACVMSLRPHQRRWRRGSSVCRGQIEGGTP